jgi:hypothetical protein
MTYQRFWSIDDVERYFPVEALTKDREVFEQVHVPIDRIEVDLGRVTRLSCQTEHINGQRVVLTSEDKLLHFLGCSKPTDPNRIIMVVGETGSGKSELCQSLAYQLEGHETHVPILVKRSRTKLRDIVQTIESALGEHGTEPRELDHVSPQQFSAAIKLALLEYIDSTTAISVFGPGNVDALRKIVSLPIFEETFQDVYERYRAEISQPGGARRPDLLPFEVFTKITRSAWNEHGINLTPYPQGSSPVQAAYQRLEPKVREALARFLSIDDLVDKVRRLSDRFAKEGRRPVLLIEDITTFGFLQNDLLDYLFDLSGGHYDVVLGITTDFERFNQESRLGPLSTIRDRLEVRLLLTREGSTLFADRMYNELARRHLQAVVLPPAAPPPWWNAFDGLYPLNPFAVQRIWNGLQENGQAKRTPRLLLRMIRAVLEDERLPADVLSHYFGSQLHAPAVDTVVSGPNASSLRSLATWYGYPCRNGIYLHEDLLAAFGLSAGDHQVVDQWVVLPLTPALRQSYASCEPPIPGQLIAPPTGGAIGPTLPPQPGRRPPPPEQRGDGTTSLLAAREALVAWLKTGGEFPHREMLARGTLAALEFFQLDPFSLERPGAIAEQGRAIVIQQRATPESRVAVEGLSQDRDITRLLIPRRAQDQGILEHLLLLGEDSRRLLQDGDLPRVALQQYLVERAEETRCRARDELQRLLGGLCLPEVSALAQLLLLSGLGRLALSESSVARDLTQPCTGTQSADADDALYQAPEGLHPQWGRFYKYADVWQGIFVATFYLQGSFVDYDSLAPYYDQLRDQTAFMSLLGKVARADPRGLSTRFAIAGRSTPADTFSAAVASLQEYTRALTLWLRQHTRTELAHRVRVAAELLPQASEFDRLRDLVDQVVAFQEARSYLRPSWRRSQDLVNEDDAVSAVLMIAKQLNHVEAVLGYAHPANVVFAAQHLRRIEAMPTLGALRGLGDLRKAVAEDHSLDDQATDSNLAQLGELLSRLQVLL